MKPYLDPEYNVRFEITGAERTNLLSDFSAINNQFEPFGAWMNNPDVPRAEKQPYDQKFMNIMQSMAILYNLLRWSGIPETEIREWTKLPF